MKKVIIAFDVDGTLIDSDDNPNWRITELLRIFSTFKNVHIVVWSGGGREYAKMWVRRLELEQYVWKCISKTFPGFSPDIVIDDQAACELGLINLIVRER